MNTESAGSQQVVYQPVRYLPYQERVPDMQLHELGLRLLDTDPRAYWEDSPQGARTRKLVAPQLVFDMRNGFPIQTDRDMLRPIMRKREGGGEEEFPNIFSQAIGEWAAFANGAHTADEIEKYGNFQWARFLPGDRTAWIDMPAGDNGPGSYGPGFVDFPSHEGVGFNQLKAVVRQMHEHPFNRNHWVSPWVAPYVFRGSGQKTLIVPCHGTMHFMIDTTRGELHLHHIQRSGDLFVGVAGCNIPQYAAVGMVVANILGLEFRTLYYTISDCHVYDFKSQIERIRILIDRKPTPFPTVKLTRNFTALDEMRAEHFVVSDYYPHPWMNIPTPT